MNANRICYGLACCAALGFAVSAIAQGFAGLGGESEGFAEVKQGAEISFPADHGPHPDHRIEWWYLTANLTDAAGKAYGVQWTLFRQAAEPPPQREGWESQQFWLGHAALTTATAHLHGEKLARGGSGQAGVTAQPFAAWIDDWTLETLGDGFAPLRLRVAEPGFGYELTLETVQPMVLQGEGGYSVKSERGQASYYVSQPFFAASGILRIGDEDVAVSGKAWMDREWSSQPLAPDQEGWDWFSLHLETGEKVMLFRLRHSDGANFYAGNWISAAGQSTALSPDAIALEPLAQAKTPGGVHPTRWRLQVEGRGLDVTADALNPAAWNATMFPYWEGPVTVSGSHGGVGYLEMTGYR